MHAVVPAAVLATGFAVRADKLSTVPAAARAAVIAAVFASMPCSRNLVICPTALDWRSTMRRQRPTPSTLYPDLRNRWRR